MLIGALGAIIFVPLIAPILVPWLKKIPVVGKNY